MDRGRHAHRGGDAGTARPTPGRRTLLALGAALPIAAYFVFRRVLGSDTYALAVSVAIPLTWTLAGRGRRAHPVAVAAAILFAIALLVSLASGGSALPLKLRRGLITGPLGLACLISVAARRPLLPALLGLVAPGGPSTVTSRVRRLRSSLSDEAATGLTLIVGVTLLADAAVQVTLALTVPTTVFVTTDGLARLGVAALGVGACAAYLRIRRGALSLDCAGEAERPVPPGPQRP